LLLRLLLLLPLLLPPSRRLGCFRSRAALL